MTAQAAPSSRVAAGRRLNIGLWVAQAVIALAFVVFGAMKLFMPVDALARMWIWPGQVAPGFLRFMGVVDVAGGLGVLLPALTRIQPRLTVHAALGCTALQICAIVFHLLRGEAAVTPLNFVLLALCVFIWWGRARKAPIAPRAAAPGL